MKRIKSNELFRNLSQFLNSRGIELKETGDYTQRIQRCCRLLTDAVNTTQDTLVTAKTKLDAKLDRMRQVIHEKTAPKTAAAPPPVRPAKKARAKGAGSPPSRPDRAEKKSARTSS